MTAVRDLRAPAVAVAPFVALMWLVAAGVAATADDYDQASWWLLLVNQLVLVPALVGAAWWLGRRLAGPIGAVVAPLAVILVPVLGVLYANEAFRETYVDRVLTLAVGIADGWSLAAGALLLVAVALIVAWGTGRGLVAAGAALGAAVLAVAACCAGVGLDVSWDAFEANMAGLREFTWSNRLLQWLPLAGAIGVARRSRLAALSCSAVWFGAFALAWGASPNVDVGDGSFSPSPSSRRCPPSPCSSPRCRCSSRRCRPAWNGSTGGSLPGVEADPVEVRLPVAGDRTGDTPVPEACRCSPRRCGRARRSGRRRPRSETKS